MSRSLVLMLCLLTALLVLACTAQETNRNLGVVPSGTPAASPSASASATVTAGANQVGVTECDNFINAYENCVSTKVPEAARGPLRDSIARLRTDWKKLADNPQTRGTLAAACTRQVEATRTQMGAYGCTF